MSTVSERGFSAQTNECAVHACIPLQEVVVVGLQKQPVCVQVPLEVVRSEHLDDLEQLIFIIPSAEKVFSAEDLARSTRSQREEAGEEEKRERGRIATTTTTYQGREDGPNAPQV